MNPELETLFLMLAMFIETNRHYYMGSCVNQAHFAALHNLVLGLSIAHLESVTGPAQNKE